MPAKFTKKHYEAIAEVIRGYESIAKPGTQKEYVETCTLQTLINDLDRMFEHDNPKYDSARFKTKCGWHPVR